MTNALRAAFLLLAAAFVAALAGCARGGEDVVGPEAVMDVYVAFAGPVDESAYYYVAVNRNGGYSQAFPIPVAAGPFWGNGWGTGSITHYLQYQLGRYDLYSPHLVPNLILAGGGVSAVSGVPSGSAAGLYTLRTGDIAFGGATVSGAGMIASATNNAGQNAGTLALATDAAGQTVAGSVSFSPAATGGRAPNTNEQVQLSALNAGGVTLAADSLSAFGLTLTLNAAQAGSQTLTIAATSAPASGTFTPNSPAAAQSVTGTLVANAADAGATSPIPGSTITTGDLVAGGQWRVDVEFAQVAERTGSPYTYTLPAGGNALRATIDLADFGTGLSTLSLNIIATTELITDPAVTDASEHCYDALGPLGNDAISITTTEYQTSSNSTAFVREGTGDSTLKGHVTAAQRAAVDIADWSITLRRLQ
jgi:hypothetical protein